MSSQSSNNNIKKISIALFTVAVVTVSFLSIHNFLNTSTQKSASALSPLDTTASTLATTASNLIIGTTDIGSAIQLSVCVQATPGPIHLANVSTWFQFNTSALTPTANTFVQKGQYGNSNNGYGPLKWQQVSGTQNGTSDTYTMSLVYSGDGVTPGLAGLPMTTTRELFGKVNFAKVSGSTASTAINLVKNIYYSTENPTTAVSQTVSYVNGDCTTSTNVIVTSSLSSISLPSSTSSIPTNTVSSSSVTAVSSSLIQSSSRMRSSSVSVTVSPSPVNIVITPNTQVPNIPVPIEFTTPGGLPNNISATFKFPGSNTTISGIILNNIFVPNVGQIVPNDVITFYGTNSFGSGILQIGSMTYNIPTRVINSNNLPYGGGGGGGSTPASGGSITISLDNKSVQSSQTSKSSVSNNVPIATEAQVNLESKNNGVFKSKLKITDPYVCGVGSYGNVPNAKEFGVDNVYYDFYKQGSTKSSYSFKLKLNSNGDFFLPISKSSNVIEEGKYQVVYYALDNEGIKAQGEFTDYITDNCIDIQNSINPNSVRTGGSQFASALISLLTILALAFIITKSANKSYSINSIFGKK